MDPDTGRPGVAALRRPGDWAAEERPCGDAAPERLGDALLPEGREGVTLRLPEDERVAAEPEGWEVEYPPP